MSMRRSIAAIARSARTVELTRTAQEQTEAAIRASLKLLREPVYPGDSPPRREH